MTGKPRPLAIFNAGPFKGAPDQLYRHYGEQPDLFGARLGLLPGAIVGVDVQHLAVLPPASEFSGVIVSGSPAMVTERLPWAERAAAWIAASHGRVPMLGVCFGHQLVAHALGGQVIDNPAGSEYGTVEVETLADAAGDPLIGDAPRRFLAQAAHSQSVAVLPSGAVALARNGHGLQAARYGRMTWGVQFHPEFDAAISDMLLTDYGDYLRKRSLDPEALRLALQKSPAAHAVLARFGALVESGLVAH